MILKRRTPAAALWAPTASASGWAESTLAEVNWDRNRRGTLRWAVAGGLVGAAIGLAAFAPASWLAAAVASASDQRLLLAEARGTVWRGSAVAVLAGGPGSRDASALPGRIEWDIGLAGRALAVKLRHACCLDGQPVVRVTPGFGTLTVALPPAQAGLGRWPTSWFSGLGAPFNTMDLGGTMRLSTPGLTLERVRDGWRINGRAELQLQNVSSRLVPLPALGSYRLTLSADPTGNPMLGLATSDGALQLSGSGTLGAKGLRFRGEARAAPGQEAVLNNLLNIIGRRDGARSVLSIG
jgi:general secretion pathway protein N